MGDSCPITLIVCSLFARLSACAVWSLRDPAAFLFRFFLCPEFLKAPNQTRRTMPIAMPLVDSAPCRPCATPPSGATAPARLRSEQRTATTGNDAAARTGTTVADADSRGHSESRPMRTARNEGSTSASCPLQPARRGSREGQRIGTQLSTAAATGQLIERLCGCDRLSTRCSVTAPLTLTPPRYARPSPAAALHCLCHSH